MYEEEKAYILEHYGVKGMKWGVRKKDDSTSRQLKKQNKSEKSKKTSESKEEYLKALDNIKKPSKKQQVKNLKDSEEKSLNKIGIKEKKEKDGDSSFPTRNQLITIGVGAAFVGAGIIAYKYGGGGGIPSPGSPVSHLKYKNLVQSSKSKIWTANGYVTKESFDIPPMEFGKGHKFYRLSTELEKSFDSSSATYAVASKADFHRYVSAFSQEKLMSDSVGLRFGGAKTGLNVITFKALEPIRVPDLETRLDVIREVMHLKDDRDGALAVYNAWSGGSWGGIHQKAFFDKLKARGFDAIVDDMDAGVIGEIPLVIFSPEKFSKKEAAPLTVSKVREARKNITELINRRPPT